MRKYNLVACGGTFDLLHRGHQEFLKFALSLGEKVVIGITSDKYVEEVKSQPFDFAQGEKSKVKSNNFEDYEVRKSAVERFLNEIGVENRVQIVPLNDAFGPTVSNQYPLDALVVTENTVDAAQKINSLRQQKGLNPLAIEVFKMIRTEDGGIISSGRIRSGEIDREGKLYINPQWVNSALYLPENLREELKKPLGELLPRGVASFPPRGWNKQSLLFSLSSKSSFAPRDLDASKTITVGDVVTKSFNEVNFGQWLSIVDFKVARENKFAEIRELGFLGNEKIIKVNNPTSMITVELMSAVNILFRSSDFSSRVIIKVDGEEDLAVLPVLLAASLGFTVFYGQPNQGVVKVGVTEKSKEKAYQIVDKFKI